MDNWKKCTIADIGTVVGGATPSTTNPNNYDGGQIAWITPKDLSNHKSRFISHGERNITEHGLKSCSTQLLPKNSILFTSRAPIGYVAIAANEVCTNQGFKSVIPNENTDYMFLYYLLLYNKDLIESMGSGTTFKEVSGKTMQQIPVQVPPFEEQKRISKILSSLDDKIELNAKINDNLEKQAQALFKNWFIDYAPFGGVMPDDWIEGKLGDFVEIKRGGSPRPIQEYLSDSGYRWLKISDVTSLNSPFILEIAEYIKETGLNKTVFLKAGSLVLSNSATPGIPKILDLDSCIHDGWLYFPQSKLTNEFLYLFFKEIRKDLVNLGNGSIFTNLKTEILKNFEITLPSQKILDDFQKIVESLFIQMLNIQREIQRLTTLRDTLLPKLMSGEMNVENIQI
ncbi:restriction endonuclease subunit S [Fibrobacter sp. UWH3]|uniref:restriction endonuclease subunit S n=1 Tax=Fibrobacter sp. UWH3 TaxID=1964353 RepID=UPI000B51F2F9|nr:restriction endonuclease subunit S [Fibrobacter sp. UWH3]OWV08187.1 hypothetical protein B7993_00690 [Fibrobacter sp. UWH3]